MITHPPETVRAEPVAFEKSSPPMQNKIIFPLNGKRVWVAGHRGMVGAALVRRLEREPCEILTVDRRQVDLQDQSQVRRWIHANRPDAIILAAAKVGGILANNDAPADFLADNLEIEMNVIGAARQVRTPKLLFLGSSCIYPKLASQPIVEEALLTGALEPTNEWYAIAKIAGLKLVEACRKQDGLDFISAMPTNLYGSEDNFDPISSHVLPALIRKAHEAKQRADDRLVIWGSGTPLREFLHVDDCADALVTLLQRYSDDVHVNVGSGEDLSIRDLSELVAEVVGFRGAIVCDTSKPDGTPRKLMSAERIRALGWRPTIPLREGVDQTYRWFLRNEARFVKADASPTVPASHPVIDGAADQVKGTHVVFINYGLFNSNSGGHTAKFANALAARGAHVSVIGAGDPETVADFGPPGFRCYTHEALHSETPEALLQTMRSPQAIIHAWTPRETVRLLTERLVSEAGCPYIVHLEDNEEVITSSQLGTSWAELIGRNEDDLDGLIPMALSHPLHYRSFLENAQAVTIITESLKEVVPLGVPCHLLEPWVDTDVFAPAASQSDRQSARAKLFIDPDATVLVYHGNMHSANRREIFSLYTALTILRRRGYKVVLIRAGKDFVDDFDVSMEYLRRQDVINLGYLERETLIATLKLADVFVQPGAADEFNKYRLPSKVPEFLALGRPVILPRTNLGLKLADGREALLLDRGDGVEIADKVEFLIGNPAAAQALGTQARSFAMRNMSEDDNFHKLAAVYRSVLASASRRQSPHESS